VVEVTALVILGLVTLAVASGVVGWYLAARRQRATVTSLRQELASASASTQQLHEQHKAIVSEMAHAALRVIRTHGGETS
jgi:hypothetical protein